MTVLLVTAGIGDALASGRGLAVGAVYRLADGRLVYVEIAVVDRMWATIRAP